MEEISSPSEVQATHRELSKTFPLLQVAQPPESVQVAQSVGQLWHRPFVVKKYPSEQVWQELPFAEHLTQLLVQSVPS